MKVNKLVPRLGILCAIALASAGCSAGYIFERYRAVGPTVVDVGCGSELYEVYENPRERTVMVRTNIGTSVGPLFCATNSAGRTTAEERIRKAAELFFSNADRPRCRVMNGRVLSPIHVEFDYSCAA